MSAKAVAGLGEKSDSLEQDKNFFHAKTRIQNVLSRYTIHVLQKDGMTLREYEDKSGTIFAIAWQGIVHPDLTGLLGEYLGDYQSSVSKAQPKKGQRRYGLFQTENIVVEKNGSMGNTHGRAYLPKLLPLDVSVNEIQ